MSDFYKMANELRRLLRDLFPTGVYMAAHENSDGFTLVMKNYNEDAAFLKELSVFGETSIKLEG